MLLQIFRTIDSKRQSELNLYSDLGKKQFFDLDSTRFFLPENKLFVLVLFNSTCEHCRNQIAQIRAEANSFKECELIFLSTESISVIKDMSLGFDSFSNVNFIKINPEDLYGSFGAVHYPMILVFGLDGKLVKKFEGQTEAETVLRYAKS